MAAPSMLHWSLGSATGSCAAISGRSSDTGGVGLGLAIAAEIARRHRGSLTLAGKSGGGAVATLTLPSAPARTLEPKRPVASIRA